MSTSSFWKKHTGGESLVFHEHGNEARWYDAIGPNTRKWEMRYGTDFTTACEYTVTAIGADTVAQGITAGVRAILTTAAVENSGINLQVIGTPFQLAATYPLYCGASVTFGTADGSDVFFGLGSTNTAIIAAHAISVGASAAGIYSLGTATFTAYNEIHANSVTTACTTARTAGTHILEFIYDSASLYFYVDGTLEATHTTYVPTVVMTPSLVLQSDAGAAAETLAVNWMRVIQLA